MIVRVSAVAFFLVLLPPAFPTCHDHQRGAGVTWKQISAARAIPRSFARIHLPRACRLRGGEGEGVPSAPTDFVAVAKEMHEERARDFEEVDAAMRRIASAVPNMHKGLKKIHGLGRLADRLGRVDPTEAIQALGREGSMLSGMSDEVKEMEELGKEAARVAERVKEDAEKEMREAVEEVGGRDGFEIPEGGEGDPTMAVIAEHQKMLEELKEGYSSMERMLGGVAQAAAPPATPIKVPHSPFHPHHSSHSLSSPFPFLHHPSFHLSLSPSDIPPLSPSPSSSPLTRAPSPPLPPPPGSPRSGRPLACMRRGQCGKDPANRVQTHCRHQHGR